MKPLTALLCAALLSAASVTASPLKSGATQQLEFGVRMALKGSWREAAFRFEKSIRLDPDSAAAHNNLGVALESIGEFEKAAASYKRALELDPRNSRIRENLERLEAYVETRVHPQRPVSPPILPAEAGTAPAAGKPSQDPGRREDRPRGDDGC